jgi:hypothetical protein
MGIGYRTNGSCRNFLRWCDSPGIVLKSCFLGFLAGDTILSRPAAQQGETASDQISGGYKRHMLKSLQFKSRDSLKAPGPLLVLVALNVLTSSSELNSFNIFQINIRICLKKWTIFLKKRCDKDCVFFRLGRVSPKSNFTRPTKTPNLKHLTFFTFVAPLIFMLIL